MAETIQNIANAVFMPYVLVFNRAAIEPKIERLAGFLEIDGGFDGFLKAVLDLRKQVGVPHDLLMARDVLDQDAIEKRLGLIVGAFFLTVKRDALIDCDPFNAG